MILQEMLPIVITSFYQKRLNDKKEAQMKAFSNYGTIFLKNLKVTTLNIIYRRSGGGCKRAPQRLRDWRLLILIVITQQARLGVDLTRVYLLQTAGTTNNHI